jgi:hypothetical protein
VAVDSIFANDSNETGSGGAVYIANDKRGIHEVMFMNCLFARNMALTGPDIFIGETGCTVATNTIFWGSEGDASSPTTPTTSETKNCASDEFNITGSDANDITLKQQRRIYERSLFQQAFTAGWLRRLLTRIAVEPDLLYRIDGCRKRSDKV